MNRRSETRFPVNSRALVTRVDRPAEGMEASLADVSGEGFQLVVDQELAAGTMIAVETDAHVILAEVRYHRRRGSKFATGAKRLHSISTLDLSDGAGRMEKVQILINDYQLKMRRESEVQKAREPQPEVKAEEPAKSANPFEPQPSFQFHAIPDAGKPALPRLALVMPPRNAR